MQKNVIDSYNLESAYAKNRFPLFRSALQGARKECAPGGAHPETGAHKLKDALTKFPNTRCAHVSITRDGL